MAGDRAPHASVIAALRRRVGAADAVSLNNLAWFAARRGGFDVALECARAAVAVPGAPAAAWRGLERLAIGRADGLLLAAAGAPPAKADGVMHPLAAAVGAHRHADLQVAEACYRAALPISELEAAASNGLAVLHEQRREAASADAAWRHAIGLGDLCAVHNQALAMLRRGFPHRARVALAPWLERGQLPNAIRFLAGYAALTDQDPSAAMPLLLAAVEADPDSARAHFTLGLACERLLLHQDALDAIRRALLLSPWYLPQVWLLDRGDGAAPVEMPVDHDGDSSNHTDDVLLSLGRSLLQTAHLGEALAVFDQVLVQQPSQPAALFHRGVVLAKLRRYGEALDDWEAVGRRDPGGDLGQASRRHARSARQLANLFAGQ